MIKGSIVALVSPMFEDGTIDYDSYRNLIEMHIAAGTNASVAVGNNRRKPGRLIMTNITNSFASPLKRQAAASP